ncbi:hypothetical protein GF389_02005 [Candidatus Dojkabacteria bacterium]|nr:hypothetical protein [Candidatus Dojkabacteria bacterium]
MCRILAVKSKQKLMPHELLGKFAVMAEMSRTLDNDRQKDGWGIAWLDEQLNWQEYRSLDAIWDDSEIEKFIDFPKTNIFLVHARSATYKSQIGEVSFNQPYTNHDLAYAFNGHLEGVRLNRPVKGQIGAEKIWNLMQEYSEEYKPIATLSKLYKNIQSNTNKIHGMDIVFSNRSEIYGLCSFTPNKTNPSYYQLESYNDNNLSFICSEKLEGYSSKKVPNGTILAL